MINSNLDNLISKHVLIARKEIQGVPEQDLIENLRVLRTCKLHESQELEVLGEKPLSEELKPFLEASLDYYERLATGFGFGERFYRPSKVVVAESIKNIRLGIAMNGKVTSDRVLITSNGEVKQQFRNVDQSIPLIWQAKLLAHELGHGTAPFFVDENGNNTWLIPNVLEEGRAQLHMLRQFPLIEAIYPSEYSINAQALAHNGGLNIAEQTHEIVGQWAYQDGLIVKELPYNKEMNLVLNLMKRVPDFEYLVELTRYGHDDRGLREGINKALDDPRGYDKLSKITFYDKEEIDTLLK